jgi:hypothetical protein
MISRRFFRVAALVFAAVSFLSCQDTGPTGPPPGAEVGERSLKEYRHLGRVLFIGNSLTYTNQLPSMVDSLAVASEIEIVTEEVTVGGYALIDHWNVASTRATVRDGHFDVVILQQGPSSLPENRDSLRIWTALWDPEIRAAGGRPALYAVWPDKSRLFAFPDVHESYRLAAEDVHGLFFPVGDTWIETWKVLPDARLYGRDDFHPAPAGTYAAAVVILSVLSNVAPTSLATSFNMPLYTGPPIDSTLAATIRQAAEVVIERNRVRYAGGISGR